MDPSKPLCVNSNTAGFMQANAQLRKQLEEDGGTLDAVKVLSSPSARPIPRKHMLCACE